MEMSITKVDTERNGKNSLLRSHYPGLNELRALAALCVVIGHVEQMKELAGLPFRYWFPVPGKLGVILFFVLSGFLITAILVSEKTGAAGEVRLRSFYIKRVLRIWPLYFLVLGTGLFLNYLPAFQLPMLSNLVFTRLDGKNIALLLCILPNYVEILIPYLTQIWSIGIEEQFYLVQPFIVKFVRKEAVLALIMALAVFSREILFTLNKFARLSVVNDIANQSVYSGCIAIGCLGALLCHSHADLVVRTVHNRFIQVLVLFLLATFIGAVNIYKDVTFIDYRLYAVLFLAIIVNAATNPASICSVNNRSLDYLGKISYGLYMFHELGIGCSIVLINLVASYLHNYLVFELLFYGTALAVTVLLSAVSFRYFEGFFLSFKSRLT